MGAEGACAWFLSLSSMKEKSVFLLAFVCLAYARSTNADGPTAVPRSVHIQGAQFMLTATNAPIVLGGPNVVVKGPPYMPSVSGAHGGGREGPPLGICSRADERANVDPTEVDV